MKEKSSLWQWSGFAFTVGFGTFLHFVYELAGKSLWVAPFSGVNESTWEHMKLFFLPFFLFASVQGFFFREKKNFWAVKQAACSLGLGLIPMLFYLYNGVIGPSPSWVNISIFIFSAASAFLLEVFLLKRVKDNPKKERLSFFILCLFALAFVLFTFFPPSLAIFKDPITNQYGIQ